MPKKEGIHSLERQSRNLDAYDLPEYTWNPAYPNDHTFIKIRGEFHSSSSNPLTSDDNVPKLVPDDSELPTGALDKSENVTLWVGVYITDSPFLRSSGALPPPRKILPPNDRKYGPSVQIIEQGNHPALKNDENALRVVINPKKATALDSKGNPSPLTFYALVNPDEDTKLCEAKQIKREDVFFLPRYRSFFSPGDDRNFDGDEFRKVEARRATWPKACQYQMQE
ncbi:hypothetical protein BT63DRAFT_436895 [Microthyrium microscopicum]|uniref:Uncharacterized protein n=1 Tax=Microthyrium microscopicum TaxID=703497 RepID=A0A6A6UNS9_9PEZI|nr:hypothetical protein BT63DRAFT_436895 [Microthyrium microscopicum]